MLPGIGRAMAVAMLLPITLKVEATASMIFFAGIYYGAMSGGSTTSILQNTPGESGFMVTAMEGNKMDGPEVVLIAVGLFAVSEALYNVLYEGRTAETENPMSRVHMTVRDRPCWAW